MRNKREHIMPRQLLPQNKVNIILTYRCNAKCNMCNVWHNPTKAGEEITVEDIEKLPSGDRKSTRLNSSHIPLSRMPSSA